MSWMTCFMVDMPTMLHNQLGDCYAWHKAIWQCFPHRPDADRDFLFRLDEVPSGALVHVLSLTDFFRTASNIGERDGTQIEMVLFAGAVYFVISFAASMLVNYLKRRTVS